MVAQRDGKDSEVEPTGYAQLLETLEERVRSAQVRAARAANTELLRPYWPIGREVIDSLAGDLRDAFPDLRGFSVRDLNHRRAGGLANEANFLQSPCAELTWSHVRPN